MLDSDSESNGSQSCWKWNFPCFFPSPTPIRAFRSLDLNEAPEDTSAVESLGITQSTTTTTGSHRNSSSFCNNEVQNHHKETATEKIIPRDVGVISNRKRATSNNSTSSSPDVIRQSSLPSICGYLTPPRSSTNIPHHNHNHHHNHSILNNSSSFEDKTNQSSRQTNHNGKLLQFFGLNFNKSETRHLDRSVQAQSLNLETESHHQPKGSTGIGKSDLVSTSNTEVSRYTKLPLPGGGSIGKSKLASQATSFFQHGKRNSKQLRRKSKSDNNLHRVTGINVGSVSSTTSVANRIGNDYCEQQHLNSFQVGDHATISLPWKQNNLSSATSSRTHPNTHINITDASSSLSDSSTDSGNNITLGTRQRSRSLERNITFRLGSFNNNEVGSEEEPIKNQRSNSIECHPHQRVRKILNKREQEILLRHISNSENRLKKYTGTEPIDRKLQDSNQNTINTPTASSIKKVDEIGSKKERVEGGGSGIQGLNNKPPNLSPVPERFSVSAQNSPKSSTANSPGAFSCPPSPPPRPPSTLRRRLDKAKAPSPSPTPPHIKSTISAFPFPPIMSLSSHSIATSGSSTIPIVPHNNHFHQQSSGIMTTTHSQQGRGEGQISGSTTGSSGILPMASVEDARNSGFIHKPTKGWLHSDKLLTKGGVTYAVRYIGCHDVNTSMKSLDFETRSLIAKECINQVCEAAGYKAVDRKRKIDRRLAKILGFRPRLEHSCTDVCLTITSMCIKLTNMESGSVIAVHEMPNISFASGGDVTMLDFVAYVAKDAVMGRACFVLECGSGLAQDVITTIGQAFELRFKEYLQNRPPPLPNKAANDDPEYYNDLPGKLPPEHLPHPTPPLTSIPQENGQVRTKVTPTLTLNPNPISDKEVPVNLIDFEAPTPPAFGQSQPERTLESFLLGSDESPKSDDVNNRIVSQDPFDMHILGTTLSSSRRLTIEEQRRILESEPWFHGVISRGEAESLVISDGDFLVRESQTTARQYVLTGLQNGSPKHLLLVDPEGVVRTKDRTFDSVTHLIRHHSQSNRPIISAESIVLLRTPVLRASL